MARANERAIVGDAFELPSFTSSRESLPPTGRCCRPFSTILAPSLLYGKHRPHAETETPVGLDSRHCGRLVFCFDSINYNTAPPLDLLPPRQTQQTTNQSTRRRRSRSVVRECASRCVSRRRLLERIRTTTALDPGCNACHDVVGQLQTRSGQRRRRTRSPGQSANDRSDAVRIRCLCRPRQLVGRGDFLDDAGRCLRRRGRRSDA